MSRKWTNIRFKLENRAGSVVEASSTPRTQEEVLYDFLAERWATENVSPRENIDVHFGGPSQERIERWLSEIFEACPFIKETAVVCVSDSAHIGFGFVYENVDTTPELLDEYNGYEGAEGHDVVGMISDEYPRLRTSCDWCWD